MELVAEIFEICMLILFGFSWPFNVIKSYKARTTKGKSLLFLIMIITGYGFGIASKFINPAFVFAKKWYVLIVYVINLCMVTLDLLLYVRNYRLDKANENK